MEKIEKIICKCGEQMLPKSYGDMISYKCPKMRCYNFLWHTFPKAETSDTEIIIETTPAGVKEIADTINKCLKSGVRTGDTISFCNKEEEVFKIEIVDENL